MKKKGRRSKMEGNRERKSTRKREGNRKKTDKKERARQ